MRLAGRAATITSALAIVLTAGCGSSGRPAADGAAAPNYFVPSRLPRGWYVVSTAVSDNPGPTSESLYASPGFSAASDRALLVGDVPEDVDMPALESGGDMVPGLGFSSAHVGRAGAYTIAYWSRDADVVTYVITRGLGRDDVLRAARAATFGSAGPAIPHDALPDGFELVASSGLPPRLWGGGGERITVATDDWRSNVRMTIARLDPPAQTIEQFLREVPAGAERNRVGETTVGDATVFAWGDASQAAVDQLVHSVVAVAPTDWTRFQRRVLDVPVALLFGGCRTLRDTVVLDGVRHDARWGVALPTDLGVARAPCVGTARFKVGDGSNGPGGMADIPATRFGNGPGSFGVDMFAAEGRSNASDTALTIGGTVPAEAVRVVLRGNGQEAEGVVRDVPGGGPDARRYFGAYLDGLALRLDATLTAYASDGRVVARWVAA